MVKLVYTYALGAYAARRAGSSPVSGTRGDKDGSFESFFLVVNKSRVGSSSAFQLFQALLCSNRP